MSNRFVSFCDALAQRIILGFVNVCSAHPVLTFCFLAIMMALAISMGVDMIAVGLRTRRRQADVAAPRSIRQRR